MTSAIRVSLCAVLGLLAALAPASAAAQLAPPSTGGVVALEQELALLGHTRRVLMIGAHPDDEDTELLTLLVRGMGAEAAYLSLNRGEGGQNLIGPELGEPLGLIRTEELLAARRLDGASQFFTRAFDYGYSKTLEEAWRFWPRDSVLKDVLAVIRSFRPQIIVSIFTGTPRDGHGQHQAAGWVARRAFEVAGDSTVFPEAGRPWRPLKFYRSTRFDSAATTLRLEGGDLDPWVGQSYHQIAMRGRSMHRSQDMGQLQRVGPSEVRLQLVEDRTGRGQGGLFAGIDTSLAGVGREPGLRAARDLVDSARYARSPDLVREWLARAADTSAAWCRRQAESSFCRRLERANAIARGIVLDAVTHEARLVPGQELHVEVTAWNGSARPERMVLRLEGIAAAPETTVTVPPGRVVSWPVRIALPENLPLTNPYFLDRPRQDAMYQWDADDPRGLPFGPPLLTAVAQGDGFRVDREVTFRENDQAQGEIRRPLTVVPRVGVRLEPAVEVWSTRTAPHELTVGLTGSGRDSTSGEVTLEVPAGWPAVASQRFRLAPGERLTLRFKVEPPAGLAPGEFEIVAVATDTAGSRYDRDVLTVDYPHIRPRSWVEPAVARIRVAPLELAGVRRVGYIRGASDRVPEALSSVGVPVVLLDRSMLERGDLSSFDAIVVGSRAYETDSALVQNNARLLDYVHRGGLLIVQYQQHVFFRGHFAPWPMTVGGQPLVLDGSGGSRPGPPVSHDRVVDETAPVRPLDPRNPILNRPNRIGPADWEDWVQERGLYFAHSWDDHYRPVLAMSDPGEAPLEGGLLVARYGEGTYVYTGLSFFRELPAGVPGAFRLFANLLALADHPLP